jgi:predicted secreted Zn-dependent protease
MNSALLRCVWIVLIIGVLPVHATVDISDQVEHYAIGGSTPAELRREMNAKRPPASDGRRFDGHTRWHVSWRYRYHNSGSGCTIAFVSTSLKMTITLPKWSNESGADNATRQQWSRYFAALELHEQGHRRHGVDAANDIDRAIAAMPPAGDCDALGSAANVLGKRILQKYNQRDVDYDRDTRHGATQGARFP